jgi:hypothetical protein
MIDRLRLQWLAAITNFCPVQFEITSLTEQPTPFLHTSPNNEHKVCHLLLFQSSLPFAATSFRRFLDRYDGRVVMDGLMTRSSPKAHF